MNYGNILNTYLLYMESLSNDSNNNTLHSASLNHACAGRASWFRLGETTALQNSSQFLRTHFGHLHQPHFALPNAHEAPLKSKTRNQNSGTNKRDNYCTAKGVQCANIKQVAGSYTIILEMFVLFRRNLGPLSSKWWGLPCIPPAPVAPSSTKNGAA